MTEQPERRPGFLQTWWIAARPFSLPASAMSVLFGTSLAFAGGCSRDMPAFFLALLGMGLLQAGSNVINDICDFRAGLDREVLPVSGAVVRGLVTIRQARIGALVFMGLGCLIGLYLVFRIWLAWSWSWAQPLLIIGGIGVVLGLAYSAGPLRLKFRGLGDLTVFLNFGILGALGAWYVQVVDLSWRPVIWAVPLSLTVVGILHANNWRDITVDRSRGALTMAGLLGERLSFPYYLALIFGPYLVILFLIFGGGLLGDPDLEMPITFLVTFLSLPLAVGLVRRAAGPRDRPAFFALDGATGRFNLVFGLLCSVAPFLELLR